jgi:hypothetical protein
MLSSIALSPRGTGIGLPQSLSALSGLWNDEEKESWNPSLLFQAK